MVLVRSLLTGGLRSSSQSRGSIARYCAPRRLATDEGRRRVRSGATELVEPVVANSWVSVTHSSLAFRKAVP